MSLETWGLLPKNQTDPTTIDEAIASAILAHESDPASHLGAGESLEAHRVSSTIDHAEKSIVPEILSNKQSFIPLPIIPVISANATNCTLENHCPFCWVKQDSPATGDGGFFVSTTSPSGMGWSGGNAIFSFITASQVNSGTWQNELYFNFGRVQFKTGFYRIGYWTGSWQYTDWISYDVTKPMRFSFQYDGTAHKLNVFLNNTNILSVDFTMAFEEGFFHVFALVNRGSALETCIVLGNIQMWWDGV